MACAVGICKIGGRTSYNFALFKRGAFRIVNFAVIKVNRRVARFFEIINVRGGENLTGKILGVRTRTREAARPMI